MDYLPRVAPGYVQPVLPEFVVRLLALLILSSSMIVWMEPFGPWRPALAPPVSPAALAAPVVGPDTLRVEASAWRDFMPGIPVACAAPDRRRELRLMLTFESSPGAYVTFPLDSVWLVHRSMTLLDRAPRWSFSGPIAQLRYERMPGWAVGDSFTVIVSSPAFEGGRRYLAAPLRIIATM